MDALSSLETFLHTGLAAAALLVASWSAWRSLPARAGAPASSTKTGEIAWTIVAVATLAGVSLAAGFGSGRGI